MNGRWLFTTLSLCAIICIFACDSDEVAEAGHKTAKSVVTQQTWVAIEPIQCLGNPWEQDWLDNGGDYQDYPKDPTTPALEQAELEIIKDYYQRQGVEVSDGLNEPKYDNVCLACSCPEGQTLYLQVREEDIPTMLSLGYRLESPAR